MNNPKKTPTGSKQAHDALFKAALGHTHVARAFLKKYLPPPVQELLDLDTLQRQPTNFIGPDLKQQHGDLLYSLQMHDGKWACTYFLLEHQSSEDPHMVVRLLPPSELLIRGSHFPLITNFHPAPVWAYPNAT